MKSPFTGKDMIVVTELREMTFRKEQFNLIFHAYKCVDTGDQFEDEKFAELNYNQVINQYRAKHHIPFPEQIAAIRKKYDLSAAKISEVLGMGPNTWASYESGEVPSKVHANLIQMIDSPDTFKQLISKNGELAEKDRLRILKKIELLAQPECVCDDELKRFATEPNIYNGYKVFSSNKTSQMVLFYAQTLKPYKTKMNKLLFYSDFAHFRENGQSISGLKYVAIPYGPVPDGYEMLYGILSNERIINLDLSMTELDEITQILPAFDMKYNPLVFSSTEIKAMEYIAEKFKNINSKEIVEISHKEPAWIENIEGNKPISFEYAFRLETI
jgi:putative zinc finger/helix-turn-helix YgiT family protein